MIVAGEMSMEGWKKEKRKVKRSFIHNGEKHDDEIRKRYGELRRAMNIP